MMNKQTVYDLKPEGKVVYIRVDYNVPHDKEGNILDDRRIRATIPTIHYLLNQGAAIVLASHMGRPKGETSVLLQPVWQNFYKKKSNSFRTALDPKLIRPKKN